MGSQSQIPINTSDPPSVPAPAEQHGGSRSRVATPDLVAKEHISQTDPRRFTPTLHASLVGEILSLRRELENKSKDISQLEDVLHHTRADNEHLTVTLNDSNRETRNLRKQMELLEGGTLSAIDDLAKERDEAVANLTELHRRLEQSQKRARSQEDQAEMTQRLYESDKSAWETDRRALETKVHVVENRLKAVLSEIAASQEVTEQIQPTTLSGGRVSVTEGSIRSESAASMRPKTRQSRRRASTISSGPHDLHIPQRHDSVEEPLRSAGGLSLADELAVSDEDGELVLMDDDEDEPGEHSPDALPEERSSSTQPRSPGLKARKLLGLSIDVHHIDSGALGHLQMSDEEEDAVAPAAEYIDTATQYSPPPTPPPAVQSGKLESVKEESSALTPDVVANQGRKRIAERKSNDDLITSALKPPNMTSSSVQTVGDLPSPPTTPKLPGLEGFEDTETQSKAETVSRETQTDEVNHPEPDIAPVPVLQIPKIAIHPPTSRPETPREGVVLPPHTKNAACQVVVRDLTQQRSIGIQTAEIRVDNRPTKLPPHLIPAPTIRSRSPEKNSGQRNENQHTLRKPPPVASSTQPLKANNKELAPTKKQFPGNDTGRLSQDLHQDIRRPERTSSLFAGFDAADDEEKPKDLSNGFGDDDDIFNRPMISYTLKAGKMVKSTGGFANQNIPLESDGVDFNEGENPSATAHEADFKGNNVLETVGATEFDEDEEEFVVPGPSRPSRPTPSRLASNSIRRTALISSGTAAHQAIRARSPSLPSSDNPPFPVPTRHSSRKIPISSSDGTRSPTPNGSTISYDEEPNLRKSRSAAAVAYQDRLRSETPPLLSASTIPESPSPPPMPSDQLSPFGYQTFRSPDPNQWSTHHERDLSVAESTSVAQTTVVDAIAQTMVGEWMWKYVRRGKSFGQDGIRHPDWDNSKSGDDLSTAISHNGTRHRRWVWLAPYERAVMWSSKQPTSGPALLGKSGRKLAIQSVLDVKDDNVLPKGSGSCFNRSILILTPQRALKFTARNQERHYLWLSALSFLSHSPNDISDLDGVSLPLPHEESAPPPVPTRSSRRPAIRDSIRVAKGRDGPRSAGVRAFTTDGIIPRTNQINLPQPTPFEDSYDDYEAADAPTVPRTSSHTSALGHMGHTRKRSNTAPRPPPTAFRTLPSISGYASSHHSGSAGSSSLEQSHTFSSSVYNPHSSSVGQPSVTGGGLQSTRTSLSRRTSTSSGQQAQAMNNYFDNLGTVRMEAFIKPEASESHHSWTSRQHHSHNRGLGAMGSGSTSTGTTSGTMRSSYRTRHGRKKDMSYWGAPSSVTSGDVRSVGGSEGSRDRDSWAMKGDDPFRGF